VGNSVGSYRHDVAGAWTRRDGTARRRRSRCARRSPVLHPGCPSLRRHRRWPRIRSWLAAWSSG
jgi:hypothetical protein